MTPQYSISRKIYFCAGHRVFRHESKCRTPHGHGYVLTVHARSHLLDALGRVIDFGVLKERLEPWIDANWDHTTLVFKDDIEYRKSLETLPDCLKPPFIMPVNPTAENMAQYLLSEIFPMLMKDTGVQIWKVDLEETPKCCASVTFQDAAH